MFIVLYCIIYILIIFLFIFLLLLIRGNHLNLNFYGIIIKIVTLRSWFIILRQKGEKWGKVIALENQSPIDIKRRDQKHIKMLRITLLIKEGSSIK